MAWDSPIVCGIVGVDTEEDAMEGATMKEEWCFEDEKFPVRVKW